MFFYRMTLTVRCRLHQILLIKAISSGMQKFKARSSVRFSTVTFQRRFLVVFLLINMGPLIYLLEVYSAPAFFLYSPSLLLVEVGQICNQRKNNLGPWWLFILRLIEGLGEGVTFPAAASFWTRWSLPDERARLMGLSLAGSQIGNVLGIPLTGIIADKWGWPSVFYWFGAVGCIWCIIFYIYARNDPSDCPWISAEEKRLLQKYRPSKENRPIPWKKVFTCRPLLALAVAHASFNWGFYVLFTCLPKYMKEVLGFDLKHNAYYSALPYLTLWIFMNVSTQIGDRLLKKEVVAKITVRKLFNTLSTFIPAILFTFIPFFGCDGISVVILICVCCMFKSGHYASVNVNHSDLAPPFTG